jgi:hypothetical protein
MKAQKKSDWALGLSLSVFLPMLVNLIVLATYLLDS